MNNIKPKYNATMINIHHNANTKISKGHCTLYAYNERVWLTSEEYAHWLTLENKPEWVKKKYVKKLAKEKMLEEINPRWASELYDKRKHKKVELILAKEKENGKH
jgi:uncharacterized protein YqgQ